jgi:hypothetical protein
MLFSSKRTLRNTDLDSVRVFADGCFRPEADIQIGPRTYILNVRFRGRSVVLPAAQSQPRSAWIPESVPWFF